MGLFDDLLGGAKKTDPVTQVTPVATDNLSVVMPAQNVTPEAIDAMLNVSAGNVTAEMPSYTAQKAEQNSSPIIVSETPMVTENSPVVTPVETISTVISEAPMTPVMPAIETPVVTFDMPVTPVATETPAPVIVESSTPVVDFSMPTILTETPVQATEVTTLTEASVISEAVEIPNSSLFDFNTSVVETPVQTTAVVTPEVAEIESLSVEAPQVAENSLFSLATENTETPSETPVFAFANEVSQEEKSENISEEISVIPENTENFLAAGLLQLEKMEKTLASRKEKFLAEAEEYRKKKEEFAELEQQAIENSHSMDDEQKKIDTMKKYFNKQLEGPNINDSVDTALTGIAVQNAVGNTIEKKTTRKKTTSLV